ncbi:unnamed protein product [Gulo gulo]|uniref:Uncharacterized protein n=1 Tax=Gulo gulo TaxID=48420 RepID=A0A9X9LSK1_GULGU|nr:unnamed protein product [Gulo gulo]
MVQGLRPRLGDRSGCESRQSRLSEPGIPFVVCRAPVGARLGLPVTQCQEMGHWVSWEGPGPEPTTREGQLSSSRTRHTRSCVGSGSGSPSTRLLALHFIDFASFLRTEPLDCQLPEQGGGGGGRALHLLGPERGLGEDPSSQNAPARAQRAGGRECEVWPGAVPGVLSAKHRCRPRCTQEAQKVLQTGPADGL